ncbi:hypothetical protein R6Q59_009620 [Mikania micrantha]|uniref:Wax synthase domain-containing protein n=1 Tax=Mikania micrantha TaxID=192012 RepID=A0A5N6N7L6_9ASTR|nr:hypothetical protein E3N88_26256 [Mikania micrantha]
MAAMEATATSFIIYISIITASLSYCYFLSSKIPKGIYRFISLIPIFYIFTVLPLRCSSVFTTAIAASFTTWLTNFKLIRFAFDLDQSPFHPSDSLLRFITVTSLPIESKSVYSQPPDRFRFKLGFQIIVFSVLVRLVLNHRHQFHPYLVLILYCGLLFLTIDIVAGVINALLFLFTGLELEPSFDHPYLAISLQDFWGRWNLMVTNTLRHTIYKPVRSTFSGHEWAPLAGVLTSFMVSGLMHELFVYQLSRAAPTWEMTWFFVLHGVSVVAEMIVKRRVAGRRWRLPMFMRWLLTMGFVATTGMWLFFPPLTRNGLDAKILQEYTSVIDFITGHIFYS